MFSLTNVVFSYQKYKVINKVSFSLESGQHLSILGESGSGKSTLLKLIYGLEDVDEGQIYWNHTQISGPKFNLVPGMSFIKYLAQDFDLMPFITVRENIGKYLSNFYPEKKQERISDLLRLVEMTDFLDVKVKNLSGGQMQRVAIARVLALEPEILLFDEPFSHIDNSRKNNLRRSVFNYAKEKGITCIVATHDMDDALSFSDKMIVLKNGEIIAEGTPMDLFNSKDNVDVVKLFGEVNQIDAVFLGGLNDYKQLVYPFELEITDRSMLRIEVLKCYFKGKNYLIEAHYDNGVLFFEHETLLAKNSQFYLKLKDKVSR
jgi:iron(III) transport system ATP-binding protein